MEHADSGCASAAVAAERAIGDHQLVTVSMAVCIRHSCRSGTKCSGVCQPAVDVGVIVGLLVLVPEDRSARLCIDSPHGLPGSFAAELVAVFDERPSSSFSFVERSADSPDTLHDSQLRPFDA